MVNYPLDRKPQTVRRTEAFTAEPFKEGMESSVELFTETKLDRDMRMYTYNYSKKDGKKETLTWSSQNKKDYGYILTSQRTGEKFWVADDEFARDFEDVAPTLDDNTKPVI